MNSLLNPNDPLVLLFSARLRSQRFWLLAAGAVPALLVLLLLGPSATQPRIALIGALMAFFTFYQLVCSLVLGRGLVALGGQANLDELLAANLAPARLADRAAVFSILRACMLSPVPIVAALLCQSTEGAVTVVVLSLLGQALATLNIYGSAYNNLFHSGQIPHAEMWRSALRCLLQMLATGFCLGLLAWSFPALRMLLPLLFVPACMLHQGWEARRTLINWMDARRLGQRTNCLSPSKRRPAAFWMWGSEQNPYLYRYHLNRLYLGGRPVWLLATLGAGTLLGTLFLLYPQQRAILPVIFFYAVAVSSLIPLFRQVRDLQGEAQSGNLDLAAISLGPQKLVEHLAEVGYGPRLWEMFCLSVPCYLAALLSETRATLEMTPVLLVIAGLVLYQTRICSYVNLLSLFWTRRYSRLDRLMTAAMLAQWLVGMILMFVSGALFGGAAVAAASISQPAGQISIGLGGLFIWVMAMTGCYRWIRNQAVKLASC
ncbi:MAG: hypothetical protein U0931_23790 [Vulcanimicrobiota bacterium]